ncbi:MAG: sugar phosphate isomerase/epimerase [Lentisphaerae bacterium]|nr:sugar phosphate isomerase/epimerase [Lentisphaerota bacterium]
MQINDLPLSYIFDFCEVDEALRKAYFAEFAANGVKHLVLSSPLLMQLIADRNLMRALPQEMAQFGLSFADGHFPYNEHWNFNCVFERERKSLVLRHKMNLNIAALLGVKTMTFHVGNDCFYPDIPFRKHIDRACQIIDSLLDEAGKCGVIMCVENIFARTATTDILLEIVQKFDSPHLGLCYDSGHANLMDKGRFYEDTDGHRLFHGVGNWGGEPVWEDTLQRQERMRPYVVNCHLHDNNGIRDQHTKPGSGSVDWGGTVRFLESCPRLQVLQSEVHMCLNSLSVKETVSAFKWAFQQQQGEQ